MTRRRSPPPHMPHGDGVADHRGVESCRVCNLPTDHRVHEGWEVDEETKAAEARRMGERE